MDPKMFSEIEPEVVTEPTDKPEADKATDKPKRVFKHTTKKVDDSPEASKEKKPLPPYRAGKYVKSLTELYVLVGISLTPIAPVTGMAMGENAATCADAWDKLAAKNETVRRALEALTETSAISMLAMAHAPIAVAAFNEFTSGKKKDSKNENQVQPQQQF